MEAPVIRPDRVEGAPAPGDGFLTTKLHVPRVRGTLVPRPGLIGALDAAADRRLVLVCAPAGYGKSTLVAQWLAQSAQPVAWASLDAGDDDPTTFFRLVVAAFQTVDPELAAGTAALLDGRGSFNPQFIADSLLEELAEVTRPFVLVLDDYHAVDTPEIHQAIGLLLQHLPPSMRVVLASRTEPPLSLARLRAHGDVLEVRELDLRFTREEALTLLQGMHGLDLAPGEIESLNERAEGWVAGLQLVAHALRGQPREQVRRVAAEIGGSVRFIQTYLWEEAIQRQPTEVRAFLLRTSILDRFDAQLCEAVVETGDAAALLRHCEQAHLFLIPLDDLGHCYRYHHLFADVLRDRLAQEVSEDEVDELHRRAAAWLEAHDFVEEAIRHALAARSWDQVTRLLEQLCADLYDQDRHAEMRGWLEGLPAETLERTPRLAFWLAWSYTRAGQFGRANRFLTIAEQEWLVADNRSGLGAIQLCHGLRFLTASDNRRAIDCARRALSLLSEHQTGERAMAMLILGAAHCDAGEPLEAERAYAEVRTHAEGSRINWIRLEEMVGAANVLVRQGKLLEATVLYRRVIKLGDHRFALAVQQALSRLGSIYIEWDMLEEAERHLLRADELADQTGSDIWRPETYLGLARLAWARGDVEGAFDALERATEFARKKGSVQEVRNALAQQARCWLATKRHALARRWADSCGLDPYLPPEYERQIELLTFVRLLIAEERTAAALRVLDAIQAQVDATGRVGELVEVHLLRALTHRAGGDHPSALFAIDQAIRAGEPGGYVRVFADEGEAAAPLLRHVTARGTHREYAQRLLAVVDGSALAPLLHQSGGADALSERELEVLRLVAAGLPNRDVGLRLFISEKTVKKHLSNILGKLETTNRTQAVDQARRLGLL